MKTTAGAGSDNSGSEVFCQAAGACEGSAWGIGISVGISVEAIFVGQTHRVLKCTDTHIDPSDFEFLVFHP